MRLHKQKLQHIKQNPLKYYWPHSYGCDGKSCHKVSNEYTDAFGNKYTVKGCPQFEFHCSLADVRLYMGSNRSGKTTAAIVDGLFALTGIYPEWYPKQRQYSRATKGRILANDFKKAVGEVINPKISEWLPQSLLVDKEKNNQGAYDKYYIKHSSGEISTVDIITYEQDISVAEGWDGDFAIYDEPPPWGHRVATARGLVDRNGWEIFSLTPLKEPWIFDNLYARSNIIV